jgi:integrase/recombinase XerD
MSKPFISYTKFALSNQEIERCLAVCDSTEKEIIIRLGYTLGLRRGDMAILKMADVDVENHQLKYFEEKKDRIRVVPLTTELELALKKHMSGQRREYLFRRASGSTLYRRFQEILQEAKIIKPDENRPFHALRGTCYKYWQKKNMPIPQIAELLGDTLETAMKHYGTATFGEISDTMRG